MAGLVADYDTDSSSSDSDEDKNDPTTHSASQSGNAAATEPDSSSERLPLPSFTNQLIGASVFSNPFRQAEDARQAMLEKHVKLTTAPDQLRQINGKQVCWNYRKGRCRFGRGCKYAHDSELQQTEGSEEPALPPEEPEQSNSAKRPAGWDTAPLTTDEPQRPRKKRPGLSQTLVPGKKVLKMYHTTKKGPVV